MNSIIKGNVSDLTPYQTAALSLDKKKIDLEILINLNLPPGKGI